MFVVTHSHDFNNTFSRFANQERNTELQVFNNVIKFIVFIAFLNLWLVVYVFLSFWLVVFRSDKFWGRGSSCWEVVDCGGS